MRNLRFLFASALLMLSLGAWAHRETLVCKGLTACETNCAYGGTFAWTASTGNTMQMFSFASPKPAFSTYDRLKITGLWNATGNIRMVYVHGGTPISHNFGNTNDKNITLPNGNGVPADVETYSSSIDELAIGGQDETGSMFIVPSKFRLYKDGDTSVDTLFCTGLTYRNNNNNCSYTPNQFTWKNNYSNSATIFSFAAGTLSKYGKLYLTTSNFSDLGQSLAANTLIYRVVFYAGETQVKTVSFASAGAKTIDLTEKMSPEEIASVTKITFGGIKDDSSCTKGILTIDPASIYLEAAEDSEEITLSSPITGFEWFKYSDGTVYGHSQSELHKRLGQGLGKNQVIYGPTTEDGNTAYMDVTDYDEMIFTTANNGTAGLRLLHRDATISTTETNDAKDYSVSLATIDTIGNIKTRQGTVTEVKISAINFKKSFLPGLSATPWSFAKNVENTTVSLNRNFTADQSSTIWLPFNLTAVQAAEAGKFYEFVAFDGSNLGFNPVTEPQAYTPYLFIPASSGELFNNITTTVKAVNSSTVSATGGTATFKGVLQHIDNVKGAESGTVYGYDATNGDFVQVTGDGVSIDAFRAYIVISGGALHQAPRLRVSINKTPTGVENVQGENVQGIKVLHDGQLYIKYNGTMYNVQGQKVNR